MREETSVTTETYDWDAIISGLNQYLRLRSIPIGMKLYEDAAEMEAIPKIRRPKAKHTTDQIVAQARQLGWTVGITMDDLIGAQCGAVIGLHPRDDEWLSGTRMAGVWFKTLEDASLHQHAMDTGPHGRYRAMAVSPLTSGRLDPPDICLIYGTPGQMIFGIASIASTVSKSFMPIGIERSLRYRLRPSTSAAQSYVSVVMRCAPSRVVRCRASLFRGGSSHGTPPHNAAETRRARRAAHVRRVHDAVLRSRARTDDDRRADHAALARPGD